MHILQCNGIHPHEDPLGYLDKVTTSVTMQWKLPPPKGTPLVVAPPTRCFHWRIADRLTLEGKNMPQADQLTLQRVGTGGVDLTGANVFLTTTTVQAALVDIGGHYLALLNR